MTSRAYVMAGIAVGLLVVSSCDKSEPRQRDRDPASADESEESSDEQKRSEKSEGPMIVHPEGPEPSSETVVARAGEIEVTFAMYEAFLRRTRLFAPSKEGGIAEMPPERKARPKLQSRTLQSLLEQALLERAAREHDVRVTSAEIRSFVREDDRLSRWAPALPSDAGTAVELPDDLGVQDLRAAARLRILRNKLREHLVQEPDRKELWRLYRRRHTTIRIAYVEVANLPTPETIDAFVAEQKKAESSEIRKYYENHPERYRMPKLVRLSVVRPPSGRDAKRSKLRRAADRLEEGASPEEVADGLGLVSKGTSLVQQSENRQAFRAEKGATGYQMEGPRGAYAWRVEGWRSSRLPELDRALRREVAGDILRSRLVPSARNQLEPVLEAMRRAAERANWPVEPAELEPVRQALPDGGATLETTESFPRNRHGRIPGLGVAESVMNLAFDLRRDAPVVKEPVVTRGRAVALMLLERTEASRSAFEQSRESFRRRIVERRKGAAVQRYFERYFEKHKPQLELKPIQVKYGRLEK